MVTKEYGKQIRSTIMYSGNGKGEVQVIYEDKFNVLHDFIIPYEFETNSSGSNIELKWDEFEYESDENPDELKEIPNQIKEAVKELRETIREKVNY